MEIDKFIRFCENYIEERERFKKRFLKMIARCLKPPKKKELDDLFKVDVDWLEEYKTGIYHPYGLKIWRNSEEFFTIKELQEVYFYLRSHIPKLQVRITTIPIIITIFGTALIIPDIFNIIGDEGLKIVFTMLKGILMVMVVYFSTIVAEELINIKERQAIYKELCYLIEDRLNMENSAIISQKILPDNKISLVSEESKR
jgi:hypothetical protein